MVIRPTLQSRIAAVVAQAAQQIETLVKADLRRQLASIVGAGTVEAPRVKNGRGSSHSVPKKCVYPDCSKKSKGPKFRFLCEDHGGISKADAKKYQDAWKASVGGGGGKTAKKK